MLFYSSRYKEACDKNYNFDAENESSDAKQFSQMVWKDTEKLGIGVAKKEIEIDNLNLTCFFIVGRFRSPGNKAGSYRRNVLRGQFSKPFCKKLDSFLDNAVEEKERSSYENKARTIGKSIYITQYCLSLSMYVFMNICHERRTQGLIFHNWHTPPIDWIRTTKDCMIREPTTIPLS